MTGPRFVLVVGPIWEEYPDVPESAAEMGGIVLWDRKHKRPVLTLHSEYANAICLEQVPDGAPFTALEEWFNNTSEKSLASEGIE